MTSAAAAGPHLLAGRYEVGELIGRGGMADVHAGYDTRLGRDVAIKILRADLARDASFLQRFRREAKAAATLNHPAIVSIIDSGEDRTMDSGGAAVSVPFIVMERVYGRTLRQILHADGPLEPHEAARIMGEVLSALNCSHRQGFVHRDVKPANIMVDRSGRIKVMDFGIARAIADSAATMTNTAVVIGTAHYLSPEQAQGDDADARSDLYGAACVLYELLTGRTPFVGDSPLAIAYQHVREAPRAPSAVAPHIPHELDCIVMHALAKSPQDRYQSAQDMADDLVAAYRGEEISATAVATGHAYGVGTGRAVELPAEPAEDPIVIREHDPGTGVMPPVPPRRWHRRSTLAVVAALVLAMLLVGAAIQSGLVGVRQDVAIPDVTGHRDTVAMEELSAAGFSADRRTIKDIQPPGTVVSQDPTPGTLRPPSSGVTLFVSGGPGLVTVPDLTQADQSSAREVLRSQGLLVGRIRTQDSPDVAQNLVVGTDPKAGTQVDGAVTVDLIVSTGRVTVPDVVGKPLQEAEQILSRTNLVAKVRLIKSSKQVGTVVAQAHRQERVPSGSQIDLDVVEAPPPTVFKTITPSPSPTRTPDVPIPIPSEAETATPRAPTP